VLDAAVYYGSGWQGQSRHNAIQFAPGYCRKIMDRRLENETLREAIEALEAGELYVAVQL